MQQSSNNKDTESSKIITEFSGKLFDQLLNEDLTNNIFISPYSVVVVLSIMVSGASGTTKQEILHVLGLTEKELHRKHKELRNRYLHDKQMTLTITNSLWLTKELSFSDDFKSVIKEHYDADVCELNTVEEINSWLKEKTNNKITSIMEEIQSDLVLLLLNAVCFRETWLTPFDKDLTSDEMFYLPLTNETTKTVPFMVRRGNFIYEETKNFQTVKLPYKDTTFSMEICLPSNENGVREICKKIKSRDCTWINKNEEKKGLLKMPRFSFESKFSLNEVLIDLGVHDGFDPQKADFSNMIKENKTQLVIDEIKHKVFIEVDEKGSEASAATSVSVREDSGEDDFIMDINHPFFIQIIDDKMNIPIFTGYVADPS